MTSKEGPPDVLAFTVGFWVKINNPGNANNLSVIMGNVQTTVELVGNGSWNNFGTHGGIGIVGGSNAADAWAYNDIANAAILAEVPGTGGSSANDYVNLPISSVNPFDGSSDFAVAAWFKTDGSGDISPILSSSQPGSPMNPSMAFYTGTATTDNGWNDGLIVDYSFSDQQADRDQVGVGADQSIDAQNNT